MEIHCKASFAARAVALAFTAGAVLGGGVVGYTVESTPSTAGTSAPELDQQTPHQLTAHPAANRR